MVWIPIPGTDLSIHDYKVDHDPEGLRELLAQALAGQLDTPCLLAVEPEHRHLFGSDRVWLCPDQDAAAKSRDTYPAITGQELRKVLAAGNTETGRKPERPAATSTGQLVLFPHNEGEPPAVDAAPVEELKPAPSPWEAWLDRIEVVQVAFLAELQQAVNEAKTAGWCGIDLETTSLDPLQGRIRLAQLSIVSGNMANMANMAGDPTSGVTCRVYIADCFTLGQREVAEAMAEVVADPAVTVVGHNLKFDLSFIRHAVGRRIPMAGLFDTTLASQLNFAGYYKMEKSEKATKYVLKEVHPHHALADLAERHLGITLDKTERASNWAGELTPEQVKYAAKDAAILLPLYMVQAELLRLNGLEDAARLEFACLSTAVEIELAGMPFDAPAARELLAEKEGAKAAVAGKLAGQAELAGFVPKVRKSQGKKVKPKFNPASTQDMLECLKLLGHEVEDTRDETLQDLVSAGCDFARDLLEYRSLAKQAAFLQDWLDKQHPVDDRLHASYRQLNHNSTGRFSCSNPNLQQVPSRGEGKNFRRLFKAPPGRKLVKADLAGIELRIMAWLSKDRIMIEAFRQDADLHRLTAAAMAGKSPEEVTKDERQAAKAVNFGLIYGAGPSRLMQSAKYEYGIEMSEAEAVKARDAFFTTYPGIAAWHNRQKKLRYHPGGHYFHLHGKGYYAMNLVTVRTASGRKRVWPTYEGKTQATVTRLFNTPDQGTGADIIKAAMADFYQVLVRENWEDVKLVATVHDELVAECPEEMAETVARELVECMEAAGGRYITPIPVKAEAEIGDSWGEGAALEVGRTPTGDNPSVDLSKINIYTDGACSGNPGPGGWAAIIIDGGEKWELSGYEPGTTNQRMELTAAIKGLEAVQTLNKPVIVHSDSAYLVNCFAQGWHKKWRRNGWKTGGGEPVKNRELWQRLITLVESIGHIIFQKVEGHTGDPENERADKLARQAVVGN